jgi:hypothetical protein
LSSIRVTRTNKGKRPKLETKNEIFLEADLKKKEDFDEYYDVTLSAKHKAPETSKRGVAVKRQRKKMCLHLKYLGGIQPELPTNTG